MLTPEQIDRLGNTVQTITDPITDWLIREIARRISEAGQLTSTASYEVWKLQTLGKSQKEIKKQLQKFLGVSKKEIEELLKQAAEVGYRFDLEYLPTAAAIPFEKNPTVQSIVSAAVAEAREHLQNFYGTTSIGFIAENMAGEKSFHTIDDALYRACDDVFMRVSTGAQDYNSAIRDATRQLANRGIVSLEYRSGRKIELGTHVRLNVIGGLGLMQEKISQQVHDDLGADGWEISAHFASAPDHEPVQGKQYTDAKYKALNDSLVRRIGALNCGHSAHPIILGVSQPQYSAAQLEEMRQTNQRGIDYEGRHYTAYQATQKQREIERAIREQKRRTAVAEATADAERIAQCSSRLNILNSEYRRFSKAAGLVEQRERTWIADFGRSQASKATSAVAKYQKVRYHKDGTVVVTDNWKKVEHPRIPPRYLPNAIIETVSQRGKQTDRMFYDAEGRQYKQVSNGPHGNPKRHPYGKHGEHAHDIVWSDGKIVERKVRKLTEEEERECGDIL